MEGGDSRRATEVPAQIDEFGIVGLERAAGRLALEEGRDDLSLVAIRVGPLEVGAGVEPDQPLDPHMQANHDSFVVYRNVFDNLLTRDYVSDLMRLNKSFIVQRSARGRARLEAQGRFGDAPVSCFSHLARGSSMGMQEIWHSRGRMSQFGTSRWGCRRFPD